MNPSLLLSLFQNVTLLLSIALIFDVTMTSRRGRIGGLQQVFIGILLGAIGITAMSMPWMLTPEIEIDSRTVVLCISGLFFGPVPTLTAMGMLIAMRLFEGGMALWASLVTMTATGTIGIVWSFFRRKPLADISWRELYLFGFVNHFVMLCAAFVMPLDIALNVLASVALPIILILPVGTMLLGALMATRLRRERITDQLRESEERHRTILHTAMDGFWMVDNQGRLLEINNAYCRMSGYSAQELLTMSVSDLEAHEAADETTAHIQKVMDRGEDRFESRHRRKDGSIFDVEAHVQYRPVDGGQLVAFLHDITARKRMDAEKIKLEDRLQQAQKMESIGTLAGGIAHDFNNLLFPLVGFAELLKDDIPAESPLQSHINEILHAALRSRDLVKQILAFSRKADQSVQPIQLHPIIKEALKLLRSSIPTTINIQQNIDSHCGIVMADPTQVHQIVMNLATNAYHAMEDTGGRLFMSLKQVELTPESDRSVFQTLTPGNYALLTVSDTGTGIGKDILDKIFDPYFTTKGIGKGTGLGLSVVHGIVAAHKGEILMDSTPGKGTEVRVYLPVVEQTAANESIEDNEPIPGGTETIMLVDDEEAIVRMAQQMLERLGYRVEVHTGSLEAFQAFRADPDAFDLVITDMTMPNMNGAQLTTELVLIRPGVPVIICTGFSDKIDETSAKDIGIKGFLMKPVVKSDMAQMVRKVLDEAKGQQ